MIRLSASLLRLAPLLQVLSVLMPPPCQATPAAQAELNYVEILRCGPNALFMFLVAHGRDDIELKSFDRITVTKEGVSLLDLRNAAGAAGFATEIRRYSHQEIDAIPLPAIGQFWTNGTSITNSHFDLIYAVDSEFVYVLDGTRGIQRRIRRTSLPQWWIGTALIAVQQRNTLLFVLFGIVAFLTAYFVASYYDSHKFRSPRPGST